MKRSRTSGSPVKRGTHASLPSMYEQNFLASGCIDVNNGGCVKPSRASDFLAWLSTATTVTRRGFLLAILERTISAGDDEVLHELVDGGLCSQLVSWLYEAVTKLGGVDRLKAREVADDAQLVRFILRLLPLLPVAFDNIKIIEQVRLKIVRKLASNSKNKDTTTREMARRVKDTWNSIVAEHTGRENEMQKAAEDAARKRNAELQKIEEEAKKTQEEAEKLERRAEELRNAAAASKTNDASSASFSFTTLGEKRKKEEEERKRNRKRVRWADASTVQNDKDDLAAPSPFKKSVNDEPNAPTGTYSGWGLVHERYIPPRDAPVRVTFVSTGKTREFPNPLAAANALNINIKMRDWIVSKNVHDGMLCEYVRENIPDEPNVPADSDGTQNRLVTAEIMRTQQDRVRQQRRLLSAQIPWKAPAPLADAAQLAVPSSHDASEQERRLAGIGLAQQELAAVPKGIGASLLVIKPARGTAIIPTYAQDKEPGSQDKEPGSQAATKSASRDHGKILVQAIVKLLENDTRGNLHRNFNDIGSDLMNPLSYGQERAQKAKNFIVSQGGLEAFLRKHSSVFHISGTSICVINATVRATIELLTRKGGSVDLKGIGGSLLNPKQMGASAAAEHRAYVRSCGGFRSFLQRFSPIFEVSGELCRLRTCTPAAAALPANSMDTLKSLMSDPQVLQAMGSNNGPRGQSLPPRNSTSRGRSREGWARYERGGHRSNNNNNNNYRGGYRPHHQGERRRYYDDGDRSSSRRGR